MNLQPLTDQPTPGHDLTSEDTTVNELQNDPVSDRRWPEETPETGEQWQRLADTLLDQHEFKAALGRAIKAMDGCEIDAACVHPPYYLAAVTVDTPNGDWASPELAVALHRFAQWETVGRLGDNAWILLVAADDVDELDCTDCLGWRPPRRILPGARPVIVAGAVAFFPWRRDLAEVCADLHTALERAKASRLPGKGEVHVHISDGEIAAMGLDPHPKLSASRQPVYVPAAA